MKSRREQQELNTSSLPDIVFMILFFFMAIGMFPTPQAQVENDVPVYNTGIELDETSNYIHLRVGPDGLQLGYEVVAIEDLAESIREFRKENPKRFIMVLHIDDDVSIGYLKNEIEPAVLAAGVKQIRYETIQEKEGSEAETS